jgi:thiol-disulfide isomerase/thioredoxin
MRLMKLTILTSAVLGLSFAALAQPIQGLWSATITANNQQIPFRIGFSGDGANVKGWFFNGDEKVLSTSGTLENGTLTLRFDHYATRLEAKLQNGALDGTYGKPGRLNEFHAKPYLADDAAAQSAPSIAGLWDVEVNSPKGEKAWHLIVKQHGAEVSAAILRVDGDTGMLTGSYKDGKFVLSHFSGARPALMTITPAADGQLEVVQNGKTLTAIRSAEARAKGLPAPDDPMQHTTMKDPAAPLRFSYPDLNGQVVSNTDARFRGKVVLVAIGGSWCPNCHDEAPYLEELYKKYRSAGLEVVALSFEEGEQLKDPTRLRAFVKQYGIEYPVLLAGEPSELNAKLPGVANLNTWPATFFVGRDGRVRAIHCGFAGRASGELHDEMVTEIEGTLVRLLAENTTASREN